MPIDLFFEVDADGVLSVSAADIRQGRKEEFGRLKPVRSSCSPRFFLSFRKTDPHVGRIPASCFFISSSSRRSFFAISANPIFSISRYENRDDHRGSLHVNIISNCN